MQGLYRYGLFTTTSSELVDMLHATIASGMEKIGPGECLLVGLLPTDLAQVDPSCTWIFDSQNSDEILPWINREMSSWETDHPHLSPVSSFLWAVIDYEFDPRDLQLPADASPELERILDAFGKSLDKEDRDSQ